MANTSLSVPRTLLNQYLTKAAEAMAEKNHELGARIKQAREDCGWKQKELAARVHVEPMTVSRWERGVNSPEIETLRLIANLTQKPLSFFVEEREVQKSTEARLSELESNQTTAIGLLQELVGTVEALKESIDDLDRDVQSALASLPRQRGQQRRKA